MSLLRRFLLLLWLSAAVLAVWASGDPDAGTCCTLLLAGGWCVAEALLLRKSAKLGAAGFSSRCLACCWLLTAAIVLAVVLVPS
jgi:hypothetical protein